VKYDRPPDLFVTGETGAKVPAYLQGHLRDGDRLLVAFPVDCPSAVFVIDPDEQCLVTFAGTRLDVPIVAADPPTRPWQLLTASDALIDESIDGRPDPTDWPAYPNPLEN
jgi:hypothetical protein